MMDSQIYSKVTGELIYSTILDTKGGNLFYLTGILPQQKYMLFLTVFGPLYIIFIIVYKIMYIKTWSNGAPNHFKTSKKHVMSSFRGVPEKCNPLIFQVSKSI